MQKERPFLDGRQSCSGHLLDPRRQSLEPLEKNVNSLAPKKLSLPLPALNLWRSAKFPPALAVDVHVLCVGLTLGEWSAHDKGHQHRQQGQCDEHLHLLSVFVGEGLAVQSFGRVLVD